MTKTFRFFEKTPAFALAVAGMARLAWQAMPAGFVGLVGLEAVQGLTPLASAWLTKVLFDLLSQRLQGQTSPELTRTLLLLLLVQAGIVILGQLTTLVSSYLNSELGRRLTLNVRSAVYKTINNLSGLAPFEDPRFHDTIQLAAQGAQYGPTQIPGLFTSLLRNLITLVSFLTVLVSFNPLVAGAVGVAVLPQLYAQLKIGQQRYGLAFQNSPKERRLAYLGFVLSGVQFVKEVRLFNLADHFLGVFRRVLQEIQQAQRQQQLRELRWQAALAALASVVATGAFVVVVLQAFAGRLSLGDVVLYTSAVGSVQAALLGIVYTFAGLNEGVLFYNRFTELRALPQPLLLAASPPSVPPLASGIELRDVSFRYSPEHPWVLRHANLFIPAEQCVALVGLNGAGKTTLVKLLMRFYDPTEGQLLWDGVDFRQFDPRDLRQRLSAIFQDFLRYELTAHENIGVGDVTRLADMAAVQQAARRAEIHQLIENLPQGYQTILSRWLVEDGVGVDLSGGEWQKLALARMFLRTADLLILDEPTAALDAQAEAELYEKFVELVSGRTSLLISHRFSTVRMADVVGVLEDGRITEYGPHATLMSQAGTYARLYTLQAERYL